jgi:acyl carrier protein
MSIDKLQGVFREVFEDSELAIVPEMTAQDVPEWDSFNHINLVVALEEAFSVVFSSDEIARMRNVGDLVERLQKKGISIRWTRD